jgi:hypothetical protein
MLKDISYGKTRGEKWVQTRKEACYYHHPRAIIMDGSRIPRTFQNTRNLESRSKVMKRYSPLALYLCGSCKSGLFLGDENRVPRRTRMWPFGSPLTPSEYSYCSMQLPRSLGNPLRFYCLLSHTRLAQMHTLQAYVIFASFGYLVELL